MSRFAEAASSFAEDSLVARFSALSMQNYNRDGCDIPAILQTMYSEQAEHKYCVFSGAYLKYRRVVAEWMVDVSEFFNLHPTTTHAAIAYLDRLQPNEKFSRFEWQMLAICCMLISSKYNECEEHVPCLHRLEEITQQTISNESVLNYELWALKRMGWKLNARTIVSFLSCYSTAGIISPSDRIIPESHGTSEQAGLSDSTFLRSQEEEIGDSIEIAKKLESEMVALATKCVLDVKYKLLEGSIVACAIVYQCRSKMGFTPVWRLQLTALTSYDPLTNAKVREALALLEPTLEASMPPLRDPVTANDTSPSTTPECASSSRSGSSRTRPSSRKDLAETQRVYNSPIKQGRGASPSQDDPRTPVADNVGKDSVGKVVSPVSIAYTLTPWKDAVGMY